jgi:hypothetical protein
VIVERSADGVTTTQVVNESDVPVDVPVEGRLAFTSDAGAWGGDGSTVHGDGRLAIAAWTVALLVTGD